MSSLSILNVWESSWELISRMCLWEMFSPNNVSNFSFFVNVINRSQHIFSFATILVDLFLNQTFTYEWVQTTDIQHLSQALLSCVQQWNELAMHLTEILRWTTLRGTFCTPLICYSCSFNSDLGLLLAPHGQALSSSQHSGGTMRWLL